jgi:hypothetical protein
MTSEEMQKAMEFTIEQQAQSAAKIDALAGAQDRSERTWERTEEGIRALLTIAEIHEREITTLGESLTQGLGKLSQEILKLSETTRDADERLNALINIVERNISERRNGKS